MIIIEKQPLQRSNNSRCPYPRSQFTSNGVHLERLTIIDQVIMEEKGNQLRSAVLAGVFANLGSLFGKLAGIFDASSVVSSIVKNLAR